MQLSERAATTTASSASQRHDGDHSPVRLQYLGAKRQHPDALLFFRMGDFYEMFDEDAETVARELELTLTRRDWGRGEKTAMAGVPHHAAQGYIARLIAKGYRVAVCEQMSDPALSKGLVEREVIRVVTPGTIVDPAMLAAKRNNFLAAAVLGRDAVGIAYADITTGELACTQFAAANPEEALTQELARVQPAEVLVEAASPRSLSLKSHGRGTTGFNTEETKDTKENGDEGEERGVSGARAVGTPAVHGVRGPERLAHANGAEAPQSLRDEDEGDDEETGGLAGRLAALGERLETVLTPYEPRAFREEVARERLREQFRVATLAAFGCEGLPLAVRAAGAVVAYLRET
ncbi:MAG: hypothetical protein ACRDHP_02980, partial [Ktedonobacterales bacterium]